MVITQNTRIQAYIDDVCSQIKFREIHQEIKLELETHLQEIVEEYLSKGLSENVAVSHAIAQMGSADIVGKQLNKVHKSKPEWSILTLSLIFVGIGLLAMYFIEKQGLFTSTPIPIFSRSLIFTIMAAIILTGLYLFDYRKLEPYSKYVYISTILLLVLIIIFGERFNGKPFLNLGVLYFDVIGISPLLFSIALAGILHKWDWNKPRKVFLGLLLCVVPLVLLLTCSSISTSVIYAITCITLMIVSGAKPSNFFLLMGVISGMFILTITTVPYRLERLIIFIHPERDPLGNGWLNIQLSKLINSSGLFGQGFILKQKMLPDLHTDFIFSYITFTFGWIAGGVLIGLGMFFMIRMCRIAKVVKNHYAKLLISAFIAIFAVQFIWNILMNLGFAPICGVTLPFISFGGSQLVFNAAALGVISSVYRLRNTSRMIINN